MHPQIPWQPSFRKWSLIPSPLSVSLSDSLLGTRMERQAGISAQTALADSVSPEGSQLPPSATDSCGWTRPLPWLDRKGTSARRYSCPNTIRKQKNLPMEGRPTNISEHSSSKASSSGKNDKVADLEETKEMWIHTMWYHELEKKGPQWETLEKFKESLFHTNVQC